MIHRLTHSLIYAVIWGGVFTPLESFAQESFGQESLDQESPLPQTSINTPIGGEGAGLTNWQICNETSFILRLATRTSKNNNLQTQGWSRLRPGACLSFQTDRGTPRYAYAESLPLHHGGIREWKGKTNFCVKEDDFSHSSPDECTITGLGPTTDTGRAERAFLQVDPNEPRTKFLEPANYGKKAEIAGIQRLLRESGYDISRIDGLSGRRTSRLLTTFRNDADLPRNISNADLVDRLAETVVAQSAQTGLELCNQSSQKLWSAIGYRKDGTWQSRGWWPITPNSCIRPFNVSLDGRAMHIYAQQELPGDQAQKDLPLWVAGEDPPIFCIGESRFTSNGREFCEDRGYITAAFRPLVLEEGDQNYSLTLSDADFQNGNISGKDTYPKSNQDQSDQEENELGLRR